MTALETTTSRSARVAAMVESDEAAGLPTKLRPVDYLLYRRHTDPRTRPGAMGIIVFETTPDWSRFRARFDEASRRQPRLRQKVVVPALPAAAPRWVVDPDFDLDFHVRRVRAPEPGRLREVFDLAEVMVQSPMDISRPLWTVTLVEGLADGKAAMLLQISHVLTDGAGGIEMFAHIYDQERDPSAEPPPPQPIPQKLSPNELIREGHNRVAGSIVRDVWAALAGALSTIGRVMLNAPSALAGAAGFARSGVRVLSRTAEKSPLLRQRSLASRSEALDIRLSDLHKAAKVGGGSLNDAYLAGLCAALRRYHEALGAPIGTLPIGVPVNLRTQSDPVGGNRFSAVSLAAPVGTLDPIARITEIRTQMTQRREEPARDISRFITPVLNLLPTRVLDTINRGEVPWDVAASNMPSHQVDTYLANAKVLRHYAIGALSGAAMVVVLLSRAEWCTVTVRYDKAAVRDEKLFAQCLREGFDEILALAGEPSARAVPASFVLHQYERSAAETG